MFTTEKEKLLKFQEFIGYEFKDISLLEQALTTPQLSHLKESRNYEALEILGDAVIKIIFILKLYKRGITDPGEITKIKALLESDKKFKRVAKKINLEEYIFKTEKQKIKGTRIPADIFEALCGALFLDSNLDLSLVEHKMINPFYDDLNSIIDDSIISSKNLLLEYLQKKFKTNIVIKLDYEKKGLEHELIWVAKNPKILEKINQKELVKLPKRLKSTRFTNKKDADKDIYAKILDFLINNQNNDS